MTEYWNATINLLEKSYINKNIEILNKNSSSDSIIIIHNELKLVYKLWCPMLKLKSFNGLEYESNIYENYIKKLLYEYPLPYLPFMGEVENTSVYNLAKIMTKDKGKQIEIILAFSIYISNLLKQENKPYDISNYKKMLLTQSSFSELQQQAKNISVKGFFTPYILCKSLTSACNTCVLNKDIQTLFLLYNQIVTGIYFLYKNNIQHNDLHSGNVLVDEKNNTYIFDWDLSFNGKQNNQMLNNVTCIRGACCNKIHPNGFSIDFFRNISCFFRQTKDIDIIKNFTKKVLGICSPRDDEKYTNACHIMHNILTKYDFFYDRNKNINYLLDINSLEYQHVFLFFGSIEEIFLRMNTDYSHIFKEIEELPEKFKDSELLRKWAFGKLESENMDIITDEIKRIEQYIFELEMKTTDIENDEKQNVENITSLLNSYTDDDIDKKIKILRNSSDENDIIILKKVLEYLEKLKKIKEDKNIVYNNIIISKELNRVYEKIKNGKKNNIFFPNISDITKYPGNYNFLLEMAIQLGLTDEKDKILKNEIILQRKRANAFAFGGVEIDNSPVIDNIINSHSSFETITTDQKIFFTEPIIKCLSRLLMIEPKQSTIGDSILLRHILIEYYFYINDKQDTDNYILEQTLFSESEDYKPISEFL